MRKSMVHVSFDTVEAFREIMLNIGDALFSLMQERSW